MTFRRNDLVPGDQQPYRRTAAHRHRKDPGAGQHANGRTVQPCSGREEQGSGGIIFSPVAEVRVGPQRSVEGDGLPAVVGVLQPKDAVTAGGEHGSGHHPHGLAGGKPTAGYAPGIDRLHHRQRHRVQGRSAGGIGGFQGVAVQRGAVKGRLIAVGADLFRQRAPQRVPEGENFRAQRLQTTGHLFQRVLQREKGTHGFYSSFPKGQMG